MLLGMTQQGRKVIWTEQDAKDAARLLERLDERAKKRKQIASLAGKAADSENDVGLGSFDRCRPVASAWEGVSRGWVAPDKAGCDEPGGSE
jgi:hypothetical protein